MELKLLNDLNESRQYRSKSAFRGTTARRIADHTFMDMIAIWILYNEFEFAPTAIDYAAKTAAYNKFNTYRRSGTDLYQNLHVLTAKRNDVLGTEEDSTLLDRVELDVPNIIRYLRQASRNGLNIGRTRQTLQRLEQSLQIDNSNYRSIRRLAQSWPTLSTAQKRSVMTRMLMFYKAHARRSEMFQHIQSLANNKNLIDRNAKNPEKHSKLKTAAAATAAFSGGAAAGYHIGKGLV